MININYSQFGIGLELWIWFYRGMQIMLVPNLYHRFSSFIITARRENRTVKVQVTVKPGKDYIYIGVRAIKGDFYFLDVERGDEFWVCGDLAQRALGKGKRFRKGRGYDLIIKEVKERK